MVSLTKKYLLQDKTRLGLSVSGVSLAMLLIFTLSGIYLGFYKQATIYIDNSGADLWVVQKGTFNFYFSLSLLPSNLEQNISKIAGVVAVSPLLANSAFLKQDSKSQWIFYFGYDTATGMGGPWDIVQGIGISGPNQIVIDRSISLRNGISVGDNVSLQEASFKVVGISEGTSGIIAPYSAISVSDAEKISGFGPFVNYYLVKVKGDLNSVESLLRSNIPGVDVFSNTEWASVSRDFVLTSILPVIQAMTLMGGLVGVFTVGLTNYAATVERQREYGILKALGIRNSALLRSVFLQSVVIALSGFAIGGALTILAVTALTQLVRYPLPLAYDPSLIGYILGASLLMGLGAALLPARKVTNVDPALAFR